MNRSTRHGTRSGTCLARACLARTRWGVAVLAALAVGVNTGATQAQVEAPDRDDQEAVSPDGDANSVDLLCPPVPLSLSEAPDRTSDDPDLNVSERPEDTRAVERIRETLSGGPTDRPSGDPLLDDVLQVIRGRGSILEGSSLAEQPVSDSVPRRPRNPTLPRNIGSPSTPGLPDASEDWSMGSGRSSRYRTAEMLLKAARLLAREPGSDESRTELVGRMRAEAAQLMSQ